MANKERIRVLPRPMLVPWRKGPVKDKDNDWEDFEGVDRKQRAWMLVNTLDLGLRSGTSHCRRCS